MPRGTLRTGLIGAALGAGLGLVSVIPVVGCLALPLTLILYAGIGIFAALQLPPPRAPSLGAGVGAITGALSGLGYGLINMIVTPLMFIMMGGPQEIVQDLPPQLLGMYRQAGLDPHMFFTPFTVTLSTGLCCLSSVVFAAMLGAIGGVITAVINPQTSPPTV